MFSMLIYFFGHPIYFAQLHHVNPLCKHNQENLQRKESSDQKMQENKPVLELKITKEKVYQNMWMHLFWFYPRCHCALLFNHHTISCDVNSAMIACVVLIWQFSVDNKLKIRISSIMLWLFSRRRKVDPKHSIR